MILLAGQSNMTYLGSFFISPYVVTKGGSSIREWLPGHPLFEAMRGLLYHAKALVFWQGETEAIANGDDAAMWGSLFLEMTNELRRFYPEKLMIYLGCPSMHVDGDGVERVRRAQLSAAGEPLVYLPTDDLPMVDRHHVHPEGLYIAARRVEDVLYHHGIRRDLPQAA